MSVLPHIIHDGPFTPSTVQKEHLMRIREQRSIVRADRAERQQQILESIAELEHQHETGEMETHAYLTKKRALVRML